MYRGTYRLIEVAKNRNRSRCDLTQPIDIREGEGRCCTKHWQLVGLTVGGLDLTAA